MSDSFKHISIEEAHSQLGNDEWVFADIRDPASFAQANIEGAYALTNQNLAQFVQEHDFDKHIVVYCYHGHSSQGAAQYLVNYGFENVYSMDGGFEAWRRQYLSTP